MARLLVHLGADPVTPVTSHDTPWLVTGVTGSVAMNDLGWTELLEAVILGSGSKRYVEIVEILLDAGADPGIADADGVTALQHAERRGHSAIARALRL